MSFLRLDLTMADVENYAVIKGIFSCLQCAGGCKRKILRKPTQAVTKLQPKTPLCFGELWRCMRCLMHWKNRLRVEPEPIEDGYGMNDGEQSSKIEVVATSGKDAGCMRCLMHWKNRLRVAPEAIEDGYGMSGEEKSSKIEVCATSGKDAVSSKNIIRKILIAPFRSSCLDEQRAFVPVKKSRVPKLPEKLSLRQFKYIRTLGKGGFGYVELVTLVKDRKKSFALKSMVKHYIVENHMQTLICSERDIMLKADCPFIARLYGTFRDVKYVYMVMELCLGGNLKTHLEKRDHFTDNQARFYISCTLLALEYLHAKGIVHRDLKPTNMLLDSSGYLKLIDFGVSEEIGDGKVRLDCGTPFYKAPEVFLEERYGLAVDYWSLGIIIFELLVGRRPFNKPGLYKAIVRGIDKVYFPSYIENSQAKDLVKSLCRADANSRLGRRGVEEIKQHGWFEGMKWDDLTSRKIKAPIIPKVRGPTDSRNFEKCPRRTYIPPNENSGWDRMF